jgi:hypothetical protein
MPSQSLSVPVGDPAVHDSKPATHVAQAWHAPWPQVYVIQFSSAVLLQFSSTPSQSLSGPVGEPAVHDSKPATHVELRTHTP